MDLLEPTQDAAYAAISAANVPGGIRQHVKQDTDPPFNKFGQIETDADLEKAGDFELLRFEIHSVFRGEQRAPLLQQMGAIKDALKDQDITADGVEFSPVRFLSAVASDVSPLDGVTYVGISTFEVYAAPDA